jgi:outer membrane protein OmpA-like peptidoglycan-associated protein
MISELVVLEPSRGCLAWVRSLRHASRAECVGSALPDLGGVSVRYGAISPVAAALCVLGCTSAYDQTYNQEMGRLHQQERARQAQEEAAREEARKYVAVVYFNVGNAMIHEEGYRELLWFVDKIRPYPQAYIDVKGYADSSGSDGLNQGLSGERARNVANFLAQQGIPVDHIDPAGFSSNFPEEPNESAHGRSRNRRVEVRVR